MHPRFQDGMAIIRHFHKPNLFITITCNPQWTEIQDALFPVQKPQDQPDLVARILKLKLKTIMDDI